MTGCHALAAGIGPAGRLQLLFGSNRDKIKPVNKLSLRRLSAVGRDMRMACTCSIRAFLQL